MTLGDTIRRLRKGMPDGHGGKDGRGWTQDQLVKAVRDRGGDLSQGQLSAIEAGTVDAPRSLDHIAEALGTDARSLRKGLILAPEDRSPPAETNNSQLVGSEASFLQHTRNLQRGRKRTIPVWASAEGGQGAWVVADHPMSWIETPANLLDVAGAFAVRMIGNSMADRYCHDDVLYINPSRMVAPGDYCLFLKETGDREFYAAVKRLARRTQKSWVVEQLNPAKQFELPRSEWHKAFKIVGTLTDR